MPSYMRSPIFGTPQAPQGFLGLAPQIAPSDLRKKRGVQMIGDTLTQLGIGLMGQGPSTTPQNPLQGLAQGLQGANAMAGQRAQEANEERRMQMAEGQFGMQQQEFGLKQQEMEFEQARRQKLEELIKTLPPDLQDAARADPDSFWKAYAESKFPKEKAPSISGGMQYDSATKQWEPIPGWLEQQEAIARARRNPTGDTGPEYGLAPFYTKDADGTVHAWQLSKGGGMQEVPIPEGQSIAPQTQFLDLGTSQLPMDKRTGAPVPGAAPLPVDVSGQQMAQETGKAQGQGKINLQTAVDTATNAIAAIEQLKTHPGRVSGTGLSAKLDPRNYIPGTPAYDFNILLEQTKGKVFLQAFESLKGAGAITEQEGKAGTVAIARLEAAQSEPEFLKALDELLGVINQGLAKAHAKAQGNFSASPSGNIPPPPPGYQVVQ